MCACECTQTNTFTVVYIKVSASLLSNYSEPQWLLSGLMKETLSVQFSFSGQTSSVSIQENPKEWSLKWPSQRFGPPSADTERRHAGSASFRGERANRGNHFSILGDWDERLIIQCYAKLSQSLTHTARDGNSTGGALSSIGAMIAAACVESLGSSYQNIFFTGALMNKWLAGLFYSFTPYLDEVWEGSLFVHQQILTVQCDQGDRGSASYILWSLLMLEEFGKQIQVRKVKGQQPSEILTLEQAETIVPAKVWIQRALCKIPVNIRSSLRNLLIARFSSEWD